jgi:hypothetical protein
MRKAEQVSPIREVKPEKFRELRDLYDAFGRSDSVFWNTGVPSDEQVPLPMQKMYELINRALRGTTYPHADVSTIEQWTSDPVMGIVLRTSYEDNGHDSFPFKPIDVCLLPDGHAYMFRPVGFTAPNITEIVLPSKK